jgi:hypothetical protein
MGQNKPQPRVRKTTAKERAVIEALNKISSDPETAHGEADELILSIAHPDVRAAYERLVQRCPWWAFA